MLTRRNGASRRQPCERRSIDWRRWTAVVIVAGLGALSWWGGRQVLQPGRFPLRYVYFRGNLQHLKKPQLRALVAGELGRNFFRLDLAALRARFMRQPWIDTATVRRLWPDSLAVKLHERQAVAYWNQNQLLDAQGRLFQPRSMPADPAWPHLLGPAGQSAAVLAHYRSFEKLLAPLSLHLAKLDEGRYGAWSGKLDNGLEIKLGRHHIERRLRRFTFLYPRVLQSQLAQLAGVDLRYPNGAALRWSQLPTGTTGLARRRQRPHGAMLAAAD